MNQTTTPQIQVLSTIPVHGERLRPGPVLVCPWMEGLPSPEGLLLGALPIHDANAWIDAPWCLDLPRDITERLYFGVFALDRLRSPSRILDSLKAKRVRGVINLPTVSVFDASAGRNLATMGFDPDHELDFLLTARSHGFRIAYCAKGPPPIAVRDRKAFDFTLAHEFGANASIQMTLDSA